MAIKFKELKKYISKVDRLSICFEDGHYDNYLLISDIPEGKYDEMFVYGIGMANVEFPLEVYTKAADFSRDATEKNDFFIGSALEIVLSEKGVVSE